jgi:hypothetical protein
VHTFSLVHTLFIFFGSIHAKQIIGLFAEIPIEKRAKDANKNDKYQNYQYLICRDLLNFLLRSHITNLPGAILGLPLKKQRIKFTSQANAKGRFKKEEDQTDEADNA